MTSQITVGRADLVEPAPASPQARRVRAEVLLGTGRVTFAALAAAWYGSAAVARAELYEGCAGAAGRAVALEPWRAWDGD
jgi:hypothetical protein